MIKYELINDSFLIYEENPVLFPLDYYNYCVDLIKSFLKNNYSKVNIIVGNFSVEKINNNKTVKIFLQVEHTIVKDTTIEGNIEEVDYLIPLFYNFLDNYDAIIEYSKPNIFNIKREKIFNDISKKIIYVAPTIYDLNFEKENKKNTLTFHNPSFRRNNILKSFKHLKYYSEYNVHGYENIKKMYDNCKILINIHQTDFHRTLEELRILPALSRGVVIVSEKVPLIEQVPYNEYIVWSDVNNLEETVLMVQENYEYYFNKIFGTGKLEKLLKEVKTENEINIKFLENIIN